MKLKTNIKCAGCVEKVTPYLNETVGSNQWSVDLQSADKVLTVSNNNTDADKVAEALAKAGYKAESIRE